MRNKKILSLDDLVQFCENNNFLHFSSKDSGYDLCVQIPAQFEADDDKDDLIMYATVKAFHTGHNRNRSNLTEQAAKKCMKNMAYKPVLANFCEIDGVRDFTAHDMEINDDGTISYLEKQVGCFTADKPYMEQDPDNSDRQYVFARVAIPRDYTDAADIIERKGGTKVSVELQVSEMQYDINEHELILSEVNVAGLTLLGKDPDTGDDIVEGMQGSRLDIQDFSFKNNSVVNRTELIEEIIAEVLSRLDYKSADFSANYTDGKEESGLDKEKLEFEETEVKTTEEVATETPEVVEDETFEEAETKTETKTEEATEDFEETSEKTSEESEDGSEKVVEETKDETTEDEVVEEVDDLPFEETEEETEETTEEDHQSVSAIEDEDSTATKVENSLEYSATFNGETRSNFATLNEQLEALWTLVNDTYGEVDNEWYSVDADSEKKLVYMHGWSHNYRQSYKSKNDVFSLVGDRTQIYPLWVSADERKEIENMKFNYSAIESELNNYKSKELHAAREEVLNSEEYSVMADFAEFKELKDNMDEYSVEDLANKADLVYAKFMKSNYSTFSANNGKDKKRGMVFMTSGSSEEEKLPYGGLFKNFKNKK